MDAGGIVSVLGIGWCIIAALWQVIDFVLLENTQTIIDFYNEAVAITITQKDYPDKLVWTVFGLSICIWLFASYLELELYRANQRGDRLTAGATIVCAVVVIVVARLLLEAVYYAALMSLNNVYLAFFFKCSAALLIGGLFICIVRLCIYLIAAVIAFVIWLVNSLIKKHKR